MPNHADPADRCSTLTLARQLVMPNARSGLHDLMRPSVRVEARFHPHDEIALRALPSCIVVAQAPPRTDPNLLLSNIPLNIREK